MIDEEIRERLYAYIGGILRERDARLAAAGGTSDHVHLLVELPAALSVADAMRLVKANSSKWVRETFSTRQAFGWQTGYAAFSVSASAVEDVMCYIEQQPEHHRDKTFQEEFIDFLQRHRIEFIERHIWD